MYNINSQINVELFSKTTGRSRERSASKEIKKTSYYFHQFLYNLVNILYVINHEIKKSF